MKASGNSVHCAENPEVLVPWSQDKYQRAWNFASLYHEGQKVTRSNVAYINHVGLVAMEVMTCLAGDATIDSPDLAVACSLLHDTLEDTDAEYADLKAEFGARVADGVLALTKDASIGAKDEQMRDSLARIKKQPREVWLVKLADRITNLQPPPAHWTGARIRAYKAEAELILAELGSASELLSERLAMKIEAYGGR